MELFRQSFFGVTCDGRTSTVWLQLFIKLYISISPDVSMIFSWVQPMLIM